MSMFSVILGGAENLNATNGIFLKKYLRRWCAVSIVFVLIDTLIALVCYVILTTFAGALQARYAARVGEHLPQYFGMSEFNPRYHTDVFGLFLFLFLGVGWKKELPLTPETISYWPRKVKIYLVEPLIYIFFAFLCSTIVLIVTKSTTCLEISSLMGIKTSIGQNSLIASLPIYVVQRCIFHALSLTLASLLIIGSNLILQHFTYGAMYGIQSAASSEITIWKILAIIAMLVVLYFALNILFRPLLIGIYIAAYYCAHLFVQF